ncbi:MAG: hypothetical protein K0S74_1002 [Chlamydiales bacterium]|jgi:hypothetical protein|nr:hypothetical protein [Chlamydiales bacterium]
MLPSPFPNYTKTIKENFTNQYNTKLVGDSDKVEQLIIEQEQKIFHLAKKMGIINPENSIGLIFGYRKNFLSANVRTDLPSTWLFYFNLQPYLINVPTLWMTTWNLQLSKEKDLSLSTSYIDEAGNIANVSFDKDNSEKMLPSIEDQEFIYAHELGHIKYSHSHIRTSVATCYIAANSYILSYCLSKAAPMLPRILKPLSFLLPFTLGSVGYVEIEKRFKIYDPITVRYSRFCEKQADLEAAKATSAQAGINWFERVKTAESILDETLQYLKEEYSFVVPKRQISSLEKALIALGWSYETHPSQDERIAYLKAFQQTEEKKI